jgi:hypothetical protein
MSEEEHPLFIAGLTQGQELERIKVCNWIRNNCASTWIADEIEKGVHHDDTRGTISPEHHNG